MAKVNVAQFAKELGLPAGLLLEQLQAAGIDKHLKTDPISDQDKVQLLEHLRGAHGGGGAKAKITLTRRELSEIKKKSNSTGGVRTIQVEVRKKRITSGERYFVIEGIFENNVLGVFRIIRGFANLQDLAKISVPYEMEEISNVAQVIGQQRKLDTQHAERIKRYLESGEQRFLPEVILSVRTEIGDEFDVLQKHIGVKTRSDDDGIIIQKKGKARNIAFIKSVSTARNLKVF